MNRILTCIVCPRGCQLTATLDDNGKFISAEGFACKRGAKYAEDECTHPLRTVTSTVRCQDGSVVAVKTSASVPKEKIFEVMKEINAYRATGKIEVGDLLISRVAGTDADVIATARSR